MLDVSSWALWAVIAVSVTGLVMGMIVLVTFNALADTGYGLALLVKVALVVVLLALGERNRLVLVPAIEESEMTGIRNRRSGPFAGSADPCSPSSSCSARS